MVNREARNRIARLVQDYLLGRITDRDLDWGLPHDVPGDHTANEIAEVLERNYEIMIPWQKPCFIHHKGPISRQERRGLARIAMFLRTDMEYGKRSFRPEGSIIWPFRTLDDYEEALKHPKLLCGKKTAQ